MHGIRAIQPMQECPGLWAPLPRWSIAFDAQRKLAVRKPGQEARARPGLGTLADDLAAAWFEQDRVATAQGRHRAQGVQGSTAAFQACAALVKAMPAGAPEALAQGKMVIASQLQASGRMLCMQAQAGLGEARMTLAERAQGHLREASL